MWTVSLENLDWGHSWFIQDEDTARTLFDILAMNSAGGDSVTLSHEGHIVDSGECGVAEDTLYSHTRSPE